MNIKEIEKFLLDNGEQKFRIKQIRKAVFQDRIASFDEISTLSKYLREELNRSFKILSFEVVQVLKSRDEESMKALVKLADGNLLETVLISPKPARLAEDGTPRRSIWSACISTQVGCPMGCRFCATGGMGFKRNLTAEEITDQVLFWRQYLKIESEKLKVKSDVNNIVYMGMGEPFMNWTETSESLRNLTDKDLFGFGSRSISVSTSGVAEGILKLGEEFPQVNLAVSLHFADSEKRSDYMPVNRKDNLEKLKHTLREYFQKTNRKVFIEYILLDKINDSREDADKLADFIHSVKSIHLLHVNLIRYNTTSGDFHPSSKERTRDFRDYLLGRNINATIRKSLGEEIQGACGQLAGNK